MANSKFHKDFQPRHQKGRRNPINLKNKVNNELKKLFNEKPIIKLFSCPDKHFRSPIVVTVKKDQMIKLALDSKLLNKAIPKNKYQMPNIDTLIEFISQQISAPASQNTTYFSTLDLKYAYSQIKMDINRANHCNFNMISSDMTDTYTLNRILRVNRYANRVSKNNGLYPNWPKEYLLFLRQICKQRVFGRT